MSAQKDKLARIEASQRRREPLPAFLPGDTVRVHYRVREGDKERIQVFQGVVIRKHGRLGAGASFTVRKISYGTGVERTFPVNSPMVQRVEVATRGRVRRARLYYLRALTGKKARIRERAWNAKVRGEVLAAGPGPAEPDAVGGDDATAAPEAEDE